MYQVRVENKTICVMVCLIKCPETQVPWGCHVFSGVKTLVTKVTGWRELLSSFEWPEEPAEGEAEGSQHPSISQGPRVDEWRSLQENPNSASVVSLFSVTRPLRSLSLAPFGWDCLSAPRTWIVLLWDVTGPWDCSEKRRDTVVGESLFCCPGSNWASRQIRTEMKSF